MSRKTSKEIIVVEPTSVESNGNHNSTISLIPEQGLRIMQAMDGNIDEWAIQQRPGPKGKVLDYIPHGYVRDQLNKVFGPFWSEESIDISPGRKYDVIEYTKQVLNERTKVLETVEVKEIIVMTLLTVRIYNVDGELIAECSHPGSGGKVWEKNISFADALQSAQSEALKRAAFSLGRKFGLQLYYDDNERRAEWQEKFKPPEPPKKIGELLVRLQKENVTDELFMQITNKEIPDITEKEVSALWEQVEGYLQSIAE